MELLGHRLADQGDIGQRLERNERGTVRELTGDGVRDSEGKGGLADAARPSQRDQADLSLLAAAR